MSTKIRRPPVKCNGRLWLTGVGNIYCSQNQNHDGECIYTITMHRAGEIEEKIERAWENEKSARTVLLDLRKALESALYKVL